MYVYLCIMYVCTHTGIYLLHFFYLSQICHAKQMVAFYQLAENISLTVLTGDAEAQQRFLSLLQS